jgi:integrase
MNRKSSFIISEFENPSGEIVFRLSGTLDGARIRKNFPTRSEAEAQRQIYDIEELKGDARAAITRLTDEQLREAEALFQRLTGKPHSLTFYVDFALQNHREPETQKPLRSAMAEYVAAKKHELEQDQLSEPHFKRIACDLRRLEKSMPANVTLGQLTIQKLLDFLEVDRPSLKSYNNRRGILSTFFKFAFHRGWVADNPILKIPHHRIRKKRGIAETLTVEQAAALMSEMEDFENGRWVPYFALCLFAGIRPSIPGGEITRLKPEDIRLDEEEISITAQCSKVREARKIHIHPNLAAWLRAYPPEKIPIIPKNGHKLRYRLTKTIELGHDVLRKTYISLFVAKYRSIGEAAIQAGNSESIIRKHYLNLKSSDEAERFFSIVPKKRYSLGYSTGLNDRHSRLRDREPQSSVLQVDMAPVAWAHIQTLNQKAI